MYRPGDLVKCDNVSLFSPECYDWLHDVHADAECSIETPVIGVIRHSAIVLNSESDFYSHPGNCLDRYFVLCFSDIGIGYAWLFLSRDVVVNRI